MNFTATIIPLPAPSKWVSIEVTSQSAQYAWTAKNFPNLVLESPDPSPWGKLWDINLQYVRGKYRDRQTKYPLKLKIRLQKAAEEETHKLCFVHDTGKYAELRGNNMEYVAAFSGQSSGWMIFAVIEVENNA